MRKAIAYYRVSTSGQEESRLGLEAQQEAVYQYVQANNVQVLKEFTETESGKKHTNRPRLRAALAYCRKHKTLLVIAKLDRLARSVAFISSLMETKVAFVAADFPNASKTELHFRAVFAELERDQASIRTREALRAAKKRGVVLGKHGKVLAQKNKEEAEVFAKQLQPTFEELRTIGIKSTRKIAKELNRRKVPTFRKGGKWHGKSVHNVMRRLRNENIPTNFTSELTMNLSLSQV